MSLTLHGHYGVSVVDVPMKQSSQRVACDKLQLTILALSHCDHSAGVCDVTNDSSRGLQVIREHRTVAADGVHYVRGARVHQHLRNSYKDKILNHGSQIT